MANHKRKPNYHASRSCGLCKPQKRLGNGKESTKPKYRVIV
jgi:hypothetical protein